MDKSARPKQTAIITGDPASTVAMPAGSLVTHYARGIHYDGAKDADCTIAMHGVGPVSSIQAEVK